MTQEKFDFLVSTLVNNFSVSRGVIGNMRTAKSRHPYTICVSNTRNKNTLVPTDCIVWDGEDVLYEGKLNSKRLKNKLSKLGVCCMELTTAEQMEKGRGDFICLGDYKTCKGKSCVCKSEAYWNSLIERYPTLNAENVLIENSRLHNLVVSAFKTGYKVHKRNQKKNTKKALKELDFLK